MLHRNTKSEWTKTLHEALSSAVDIVPKGWLNSGEVAKLIGLQRPQALKHIALMLEKKRVERRMFKIIINKEYNLLRSVYHYRLIKKPTSLPK
jgi:hypothetical protein